MKLSTKNLANAKSSYQIYHVQTDARNETEREITICSDNEWDYAAAYQPASIKVIYGAIQALMGIVTNDNFTASAINSRKRRSVASIASEEIERAIESRSKFQLQSQGTNYGHRLTYESGSSPMHFFLSLSFYIDLRMRAINRRLTASSIRHKGKGVAEIRSNVGISSPWPIFLEAIHFRLQNTRIYICTFDFDWLDMKWAMLKGQNFACNDKHRNGSPEHIDVSSNINVCCAGFAGF